MEEKNGNQHEILKKRKVAHLLIHEDWGKSWNRMLG